MDILNFKPLNIPSFDSSKNLMKSSPSNSNDQIVNGTITTSAASGEDQRNKRVEELIKNIQWKNVSVDNFLERMENEYCLLTFDIRNVWHTAFDVTIDVNEGILEFLWSYIFAMIFAIIVSNF